MKFQKFYPSCDGKLTRIYLPLARQDLEQNKWLRQVKRKNETKESCLWVMSVTVTDGIFEGAFDWSYFGKRLRKFVTNIFNRRFWVVDSSFLLMFTRFLDFTMQCKPKLLVLLLRNTVNRTRLNFFFVYLILQTYERQTVLLFQILSSVRSHQASPHLAQLLLRIDFNKHFSSSFQERL